MVKVILIKDSKENNQDTKQDNIHPSKTPPTSPGREEAFRFFPVWIFLLYSGHKINEDKMGSALCRFNEKTGCNERGSHEYHAYLKDSGINITVPSMWKHYMVDHLVQPSSREREIIMGANPEMISGKLVAHRGISDIEKILYVERVGDSYTHSVGSKPDTEFIEKLDELILKIVPYYNKIA